MVAQAARMVGRRHKAAAKRVHFGKRANFAGIAEIVNIFAAGQTGAGGRLDRNDAVIGLAAQFFAHEGGNQTAQVGAAACTTDDDIGFDAVFIQRGFGFHTDHRLVQQYLRKHTTQHIAVTGVGDGGFHRLGDRATQAAVRSRELFQNLAADGGFGRGGRRYRGAVGTHHLTAEGLLLVGNLDHIDLAVQVKIGTGHGKRGAPLPRSGFGSNTFESLLFCVIRLGDRRIELVTAAGVVTLEFIINLGGRLQLLFQAVSAHQRRRTVHFIKIQNLLRNGNETVGVVELLRDELGAKHLGKLFGGHGLAGSRIEQGGRLGFHVRADVIPILGHLGFFQINFVRDFFVCHFKYSFACFG